jgi:hypothetical protein
MREWRSLGLPPLRWPVRGPSLLEVNLGTRECQPRASFRNCLSLLRGLTEPPRLSQLAEDINIIMVFTESFSQAPLLP